ncbi:MAG: GAF domain-containing protein [Labilithrix sp.]|nr:GAF domain-containing protein [Labilithrix sp.]
MLDAPVDLRTVPPSAAVERLRAACRCAASAGDLASASTDAALCVAERLQRGDPLTSVEEEARPWLELAERAGARAASEILRWQLGFIDALRSRAPSSASPAHPRADGDDLAEAADDVSLPPSVAWRHLYALELAYLRGHLADASEQARLLAELLASSAEHASAPQFHLFAGLTHAARAREAAAPGARDAHVGELAAHAAELAAWSRDCPEGYLHMHALLAAERARLAGDVGAAVPLYERALRSAHDNGCALGASLAYEVAASFYRDLTVQALADVYLRRARAGYLDWGALEKVGALDVEAPHLVHVREEREGLGAARLDCASVLRLGHALSTETTWPQVVRRLTSLVADHAGARRAVFLSVRGARWAVEHGEGSGGGVPESIVDAVLRSRQRVVLHDARLPTTYASDPYIAARRPRSILCFPIERHRVILGIVYLEDDRAPGVFTDDKVELLALLAEQAGVALENARLHGEQLREIAERQEAEAALRSILDNMVDAVFVSDRAARVTLTNPAGRRLFGLADPPEDETMSQDELARRIRPVHPDGTPFKRDELPMLRALAGEVLSSVDMTAFHVRTGRAIHLRASAAPLQDERGAIAGAVVVGVNVTESTELDRLKEQFVRVVAHELKTPVAIVKGYADVLRRLDAPPPEVQRRLLDALVRGADRIDRLVTDLLLLWQLQTGRLVLAVEDAVDVGDLVGRVARRLPPEDTARVAIAVDAPVVVSGDRELVERAVVSLVDNALRYSPGGGPVRVEVRARDQRAQIDVSDHGIGIPSAKQPRLFEPFFRAHTDTAYDTGGLGLGLYVARSIASMHGGSVTVASEEGVGSTFVFTLPLPACGAGRPRAARPAR